MGQGIWEVNRRLEVKSFLLKMYGNLSIKLMIQKNILFSMVVICMNHSGYELRTSSVSGTLSEAEKCLQVFTP